MCWYNNIRKNTDKKNVGSDQVSDRDWGTVLHFGIFKMTNICIYFFQDLMWTCLVFSRAAEGSSKETQKDVHRQNGRDEEPVEKYRGALRQLVSACLISA